MHGGEQEKRPPLGERCAVEEERTRLVRHVSTDLRVDDPAVALDGSGEAAEVVGQRQLDQHGRLETGRQQRADSAEEEPEEDEEADRAPAVDQPALSTEAPGRVQDPTADDEDSGPQNNVWVSWTLESPARSPLFGSECSFGVGRPLLGNSCECASFAWTISRVTR